MVIMLQNYENFNPFFIINNFKFKVKIIIEFNSLKYNYACKHTQKTCVFGSVDKKGTSPTTEHKNRRWINKIWRLFTPNFTNVKKDIKAIQSEYEETKIIRRWVDERSRTVPIFNFYLKWETKEVKIIKRKRSLKILIKLVNTSKFEIKNEKYV